MQDYKIQFDSNGNLPDSKDDRLSRTPGEYRLLCKAVARMIYLAVLFSLSVSSMIVAALLTSPELAEKIDSKHLGIILSLNALVCMYYAVLSCIELSNSSQ